MFKNGKFRKILCIDVGGTYTKHCLVNLAKYTAFSPIKANTVKGKKFLPFIKNVISEYQQKNFDCVAIGFPGIVTERCVLSSQNIKVKNLHGTNICSNKPVYVANDVFCNAIAHLTEKDNKKISILVIIGTSVAIAFIHKGRIITGRNNIFGEIVDIGFEIGTYYSRDNKLDDFIFISNPSHPEYIKYFNKVFELIKLISAIFAPDEIVFGGGVVFYHWNSEFRLRVKESAKQLFPMYRPKIVFQKERYFDNIRGISLLPAYLEKNHAENSFIKIR